MKGFVGIKRETDTLQKNMVKVSKKKMLVCLGKIYFKHVETKAELSRIFKFVVGKGSMGDTVVSKCGDYKLTVSGKKRLKIYLQNQKDGVIYYHNVKVRMLWKRAVKTQVADSLLMMAVEILHYS